MRRFAGLIATGMIVAGISAGPAGAGDAEKAYYVGAGDINGSGLKFIVDNGKVRDLLTKSGRAKCDDGRKPDLYKAFDVIKIERKAFVEKDRATLSRYVAAGKIRGDKASGSFKSTSRTRHYVCRAEPVQWKAKEVSREEYEATSAGELGER